MSAAKWPWNDSEPDPFYYATPEQIERASAAVDLNLRDDGTPKYGSAYGYACALTEIMQTDAASDRSAVRRGDRADGLHRRRERGAVRGDAPMKPALKLIINHTRGPSQRFLSLTRNPKLEQPKRFEPTIKREGDIVL